MIIDDYETIARRLKEIQQREARAEKSKQDIDDEIDDFLIGNEEETNFGYPEYHDVYVGYHI